MTWIPVESLRDLESILGFKIPISSDRLDELLALVADVEATSEFIEARQVYPSTPPGILAYLIPQTRYFFNVAKCKPLWGDAIVAAGVYAMTSNGFASFAATSIRKLIENLARLTDDEAELAHEIIRRSKGHAYDRGVAEDDIVASWHEATTDIHNLITGLEAKGVIVRKPAGRLAIVF